MHAELLYAVEDRPEAAPREVGELGDVDGHLKVALTRVQRARPADERGLAVEARDVRGQPELLDVLEHRDDLVRVRVLGLGLGLGC